MTSDEGIKAGITLDELAAKRPAFRKGGSVTGGNSSPLNDGPPPCCSCRRRR